MIVPADSCALEYGLILTDNNVTIAMETKDSRLTVITNTLLERFTV